MKNILQPDEMKHMWLRLIALSCSLSAPAMAGTLEDLIKSGALPKNPSQPLSSVPLINRTEDGIYITTVNLTMRPALARTPIHVHEGGGLACVLQGEETLYIENRPPLRVVAPNCYYMPSGPRMLAYNSGNTVNLSYDIFKAPKGTANWKIVESGYSSSFGNQFGDMGGNSTTQANPGQHLH